MIWKSLNSTGDIINTSKLLETLSTNYLYCQCIATISHNVLKFKWRNSYASTISKMIVGTDVFDIVYSQTYSFVQLLFLTIFFYLEIGLFFNNKNSKKTARFLIRYNFWVYILELLQYFQFPVDRCQQWFGPLMWFWKWRKNIFKKYSFNLSISNTNFKIEN